MKLRAMCLGDIVGRSGRAALKQELRSLRSELHIDLVVANAENAAGGVGLDPGSAVDLKDCGVDILTLGDHVWQRKSLQQFLKNEENSYCLRPANFPAEAPGKGWTIWTGPGGRRVGVFNLLGRVFLNIPLDCPFRTADQLLAGPLRECDIVLCDMHGEATSEKIALGRYLDGRATLVFGTHTHVATADAKVLPGGTGYITDLGMCGPSEGVIGMDGRSAIDRFLTGVGQPYELARGKVTLSGIIAELSLDDHCCLAIERFERDVSESG